MCHFIRRFDENSVYLYRAQSNLHLIILQRKGKSNYLKDLSNGINDNVLNDISQALVLLTSKSKSISEIYFYAPFEVVNLFDLCLLTRVAYFGLYQRYTKAILNCNEAISRRPEWTRMWINR
ncbi:unnamed protein product [Trichobilharzia regenti]|nr:unnamed protein product [Trichobilharzia regenti]